jgi:hypothetical protein
LTPSDGVVDKDSSVFVERRFFPTMIKQKQNVTLLRRDEFFLPCLVVLLLFVVDLALSLPFDFRFDGLSQRTGICFVLNGRDFVLDYRFRGTY